MKKTILILIGIGLLALGLYFFVQSKSTNREVATDSKTGVFKSFFPFNANKSTDENNTVIDDGDIFVDNSDDQENIVQANNPLTQITDFAVSGMTVFMAEREIEDTESVNGVGEQTEISVEEVVTKKEISDKKNTELVEAIRYVEKSTGHIYEYDLEKRASGKISNATIPGVYESIFGNNSNSVLYRYLGSSGKIQSYLATLGAEKGKFLSEDISFVSLSPDKENIFYLSKLGQTITGLNLSIKTGVSKQIFSSDFTEWLPQWGTKQAIFLTTKPSWDIDGSIYALNASTGALTKIFGNIQGLTTLANNAGNRIAYNRTTENGPLLGIFKDNTFSSLNIYGLPEKCVWSKDGITLYCAVPSTITTTRLPDFWYQGKVSFDDFIVKIDTTDNSSSVITDIESFGSIDGVNLMLSENEDSLFMTNKKDGTLWMLALK